jgi:very-short-patch-repair endonuclease
MLVVLRNAAPARRRGYFKALPKFRRIIAETMSQTIRRLRKDPEYLEMVAKSHVRISSPQRSLFRSLCAKGFSGLKLEYQIGPYSADIALTKEKIVVEVDGRYWHHERLGDSHRLFRRRRNAYLKRRGWSVIHARAWKAKFRRRRVAKSVWRKINGKCQ